MPTFEPESLVLTVSIIIHLTVTLRERSRKYRKGDEIENADQADCIYQIKGLSNLIIPTDTNAHERKPSRGQKQLIIIHMKNLRNV